MTSRTIEIRDGIRYLCDIYTARDGRPADPGEVTVSVAEAVKANLGRVGGQRVVEAYADFVSIWASVRGMPPERAEAEVSRLLREGHPEHEKKLYEAFRRMAFTRSRAAWRYIAQITAEHAHYNPEEADVDNDFRRTAGLLERCEDADIEFLTGALRLTGESLSSFRSLGAPGRQTYQWTPSGGGVMAISPYPQCDGVAVQFYRSGLGNFRPLDVAYLLRESRLAHDDGTGAILFELAEGHLDRLLQLFR